MVHRWPFVIWIYLCCCFILVHLIHDLQKNAMPDPQIYSTSRFFLIVPVSSTSAEQSTYLLEKSDLTSESPLASGRDRPRREGRVNQQKTEAETETETAAESLLWPVSFKNRWDLVKKIGIWVTLWGHSERTVRKWLRNWRRRSPRQEQKEADIKNHLLHGTFVLFLLFLKLN